MNKNNLVKKRNAKVITITPPKAQQADDEIFIVAIGASAGGLETLKILFSHAHSAPNIAFVVLTHLSPTHISMLPELLQSYTSLSVISLKNTQKIKPNNLYVRPPGKNLYYRNGMIELHDPKSKDEINFPIDYFLRSLAIGKKDRSICVILSGTGADGTVGLRSLRDQGGLIIVQSTKSARYDGMPKSAINTGLVDYILPPEAIFGFIEKYVSRFKDNSIKLPNSISEEIKEILILLNQHTGHDFSLYKPNTIFRRIQKRLSLLQIDNLALYIKYLHHKPAELETLLKELLINVTNFFRDEEAFAALKEVILEKIFSEKEDDEPLRVWVPGCATGEEAYSLAILLQECLDETKKAFSIQIFGTDIDEEAIEIARSGTFSSNIANDIPEKRLQRYFIKDGDNYKISTDIRKMIIFAVQNLIKDPPFTKLDILSCRNLLIYLNAQLQKKILPLFHYSLKPKGILFLGTSETIGGFADLFTIIDRRSKLFERKGGASSFHSVMDLSPPVPLPEASINKNTEKNMYENEPNLTHLVEQILLKKYTPACIIINEKCDIVYIYGRTGRYLEFAAGEVKLNLLEMLKPELKPKVSLAIRNATTQQKEIIFSALQFKEGTDMHYINLKVRPLKEADPFHKKLFLIIFEDVLAFEPPNEKNNKMGSRDDLDKKVLQLEQELKYTKESLQTTIEELETSNEELKSSNEELQSTNEELQSTNEEIETSKEELQSLNEELTTVNAELESRIEQLSSANDDIKNLLDNTEIATVFLDKELCIKRFTPKATEIINLISSDVGRPISHIVSNLRYEHLIEDARAVLKTLTPKTSEVQDKNSHWYVVRIIPYRTVINIIDGVVITFLNIHAQKRAELELEQIKEELKSIHKTTLNLLKPLPQPAVIIDDKEKVIFTNKAFNTYYKLDEETIKNTPLSKLKIHAGEEDLKKGLQEIKSSNKNVNIKDTKGNVLTISHYTPTLFLLLCNKLAT